MNFDKIKQKGPGSRCPVCGHYPGINVKWNCISNKYDFFISCWNCKFGYPCDHKRSISDCLVHWNKMVRDYRFFKGRNFNENKQKR